MGAFFLVFAIFLTSMAGLAVGIMARRAPLRGSCGGLTCNCSRERRGDCHPDRLDQE
jgi:hypothetical protein